MSNIRANRVAEQMKKELGDILTQKIKDPRIGFVTVTDVEISPTSKNRKFSFLFLELKKKKNKRSLGWLNQKVLFAQKSENVFD